MVKKTNWIESPLEQKEPRVICAFCGKRIEDTAFMMINGSIVVDDKSLRAPQVYTCMEQAFNYAQGFFAHSVCWMKELKDKGVALYDLDKIYKEYNKEKGASAQKFNNRKGIQKRRK